MREIATKRVLFRMTSSHPATNIGRFRDSSLKSNDNLSLVEAFIVKGGWSSAFPAELVAMSDRWCFDYDEVICLKGMDRQKYIDDENKRRVALFEATKADLTEDGKIAYQAMRDIFCDGGDELIPFDGGDEDYWVNSGHQRSQFVFVPAYCEFLRRKASGELPQDATFSLDIPCVIKTFDNPQGSQASLLNDVLKDQMTANASAGSQNKLTILDLFVSAVLAIGRGASPALRETDFRSWSAEPGATSEKGGNKGAWPRIAYLLAYINYAYRQGLKFREALVAQEKVPLVGVEGGADNPDWIDYTMFNATNEDPRYNVSVIARLMEPGLEKLTAYAEQYGENGSRNKGNPTKLSAMEEEVLARQYSWTEVEAKAWMESVKPFGKSYKAPKPKEVVEKPTFTAMETAVKSYESSTFVRMLFGEQAKMKVPVQGQPPVDPTGTLVKSIELRDVIDAITSLDPKDATDAMFIGIVIQFRHLKDGNPDAFRDAVGALHTAMQGNAAVIAIESAAKVLPEAEAKVLPEGVTETDNGDIKVEEEGAAGDDATTEETESEGEPAEAHPAGKRGRKGRGSKE